MGICFVSGLMYSFTFAFFESEHLKNSLFIAPINGNLT